LLLCIAWLQRKLQKLKVGQVVVAIEETVYRATDENEDIGSIQRYFFA
jgi:hypothetical protein